MDVMYKGSERNESLAAFISPLTAKCKLYGAQFAFEENIKKPLIAEQKTTAILTDPEDICRR